MLSSNKWLKIAMFVLKTKSIHATCKNTFEILIMFHSDNSKETIFVTVFGNGSCKCMWIKDWTHGSAQYKQTIYHLKGILAGNFMGLTVIQRHSNGLHMKHA